jgi:peptidyl-prolyl cis-trans isomerase C
MMRAALLSLLVAVSIGSFVGCKKAPTPAPAATATPLARAGEPVAGQPVGGQPAVGQPAAGQPPAPKPMPAQMPDVLARVNGEAIERWEFDNAVKRMEARAGGPVPPEKRDEILRGVLDQLVAYHLLAQESRVRKIPVADTDVDARVGEIRKSFPNEQAFTQTMAAQGLTVDQVRTEARTSLEVAKVIDVEVASKIAVQDAEVNAFYEQNVERFKQGESVHASHILIGLPPNATPAQKTEAKTKAQAVLKQVRGGADFAALARAESQDPGSAPNGGDLGFFPKGQMTPAFENAAFALKPSAVSALVETPFGVHLIKVHGRRPPRTAPFAEVSGQIKDFLAQGQREQKLQQFVEQVKRKSKVEILI